MKRIIFFLLISCLKIHTALGLSPSDEYTQFPFDAFDGVKADSLTITTPDNVNIHTWSFRPLDNRRSVLLYFLHAGEGNMSDYMMRAGTLAEHGFDVVMLDYRGFGYSDALYIEDNQIYLDEFLTDVKAVHSHYSATIPHQSQGLMALGAGTIIAQLFLMDKGEVNFAVYEGFVINPAVYGSRLHSFKYRAVTLPGSAYGYEKAIKSIRTPTLIFCGDEDELSPEFDIRKYINGHKKTRKMISYTGGHLQGMIQMTRETFGDLYISEIDHFLKMVKK